MDSQKDRAEGEAGSSQFPPMLAELHFQEAPRSTWALSAVGRWVSQFPNNSTSKSPWQFLRPSGLNKVKKIHGRAPTVCSYLYPPGGEVDLIEF